jgi:UrcA family protein
MKITETLAAAAIAATIVCAPSNAQAFTFEYDSWMLSSAEGRAAVLDRLENRVAAYCEVREARGALQIRIANDCRDRTTVQALEQMNDPRVYALHQERERRRAAIRRA